MTRRRLVIVNPGHFHAALSLRESHPGLADEVLVHAEEGADLERFLALVERFNSRAERPTRWRCKVARGAAAVDRACAEGAGAVAIVAGRNAAKMETIRRLQAAGLAVLGDKPWLINPADLGSLERVAGADPPALDIMTERHELATRVQHELIADAEVFGTWQTDGAAPAIEIDSVHHLFKLVDGRPLVRPAWYFDLGVQGEGICDVTTNLVDLAQRFAGVSEARLSRAEQWPTMLPHALYRRITGDEDFAPELRDKVFGETLAYLCNASIDFFLGDVPTRVRSLWALQVPAGGGDSHRALARGSAAEVLVQQDASTGFDFRLFVRPNGTAAALQTRIAALQGRYPGIALEARGAGYEVLLPAALRNTHEERFVLVRNEFLKLLDAPADGGLELERARLAGKYRLLMSALRYCQTESRAH